MSEGALGAQSLRTTELKTKNIDRKNINQIFYSDFLLRREGIAAPGKENKRESQLYQLF